MRPPDASEDGHTGPAPHPDQPHTTNAPAAGTARKGTGRYVRPEHGTQHPGTEATPRPPDASEDGHTGPAPTPQQDWPRSTPHAPQPATRRKGTGRYVRPEHGSQPSGTAATPRPPDASEDGHTGPAPHPPPRRRRSTNAPAVGSARALPGGHPHPMSSASWHARIACGSEIGAGFLVSERHVLTCAHVVRGSNTHPAPSATPVTVSFPHREDLGTVTAAVTVHGGWDGHGDNLGDLAVLELAHTVPVRPAEFAAPEDAYADPRPRLLAYGFPKGYREGTLAEYRATAAQRIADEWVQLEAWSAHGQPLAPGFSGAAVTLADSNRVVGMVSAATRASSGVRNGRMLPTSVMARYWPALGDLIPTPGHQRAAKERLRALVDRAAADTTAARDPERLYRDAVGPLGPPVPPEGFNSLWSAAWYVLSEVDDPDAVTRLADRLAGLLDAPAAPAAPAPGEPPAWSPILIEIDHSGAGDDQLLVEVSAYREGLRHPVGSHTLAAGNVRRYVQERVDDAFSHLTPGTDELLAFVLPRALLNWPVAHWECGADDPTPLGCSYPLVVTDRSRRKGGLRHQLARKWEDLDDRPTTVLHRVECGTREKPNKLRFRLRHDGVDLAGFAAPPRTDRPGPGPDGAATHGTATHGTAAHGTAVTHFDVTLTAPVPVLLWPRTGCEDTDHTSDTPCAGSDFLDRIAAHVDGHPPAELPRTILTLRESAEASDEPDKHWARDVQLLWDDPRCFPDAPTTHRHSPVA
ncbi:trypsin-like peptidase domain-containing protein [Streptomyces sp. NPDC002855]|uniref:VMAP-C domain-containing protein n=1 Tax=Streptomyces sp. NPDC002855 TaxID=3154437 RepID=UPI0033202047